MTWFDTYFSLLNKSLNLYLQLPEYAVCHNWASFCYLMWLSLSVLWVWLDIPRASLNTWIPSIHWYIDIVPSLSQLLPLSVVICPPFWFCLFDLPSHFKAECWRSTISTSSFCFCVMIYIFCLMNFVCEFFR